jgi:hypothetical protein
LVCSIRCDADPRSFHKVNDDAWTRLFTAVHRDVLLTAAGPVVSFGVFAATPPCAAASCLFEKRYPRQCSTLHKRQAQTMPQHTSHK